MYVRLLTALHPHEMISLLWRKCNTIVTSVQNVSSAIHYGKRILNEYSHRNIIFDDDHPHTTILLLPDQHNIPAQYINSYKKSFIYKQLKYKNVCNPAASVPEQAS